MARIHSDHVIPTFWSRNLHNFFAKISILIHISKYIYHIESYGRVHYIFFTIISITSIQKLFDL